MITIQYSPEELSTVGNPIAYRISTSNANVKFFLLRLFVESEYGALDFTQVIEKESPPDTDRETVFYIQDNLYARLAPEMPDFAATTMTKAKNLVKRYKVAFAELTDADTPATAIFAEQPVRFAILGKIPYDIFPTNKQLSANNILTTKPTIRRLGYHQLDYITILSPSNSYAIQASITLLYQDNTTQTLSLDFGSLEKYQIGFVPIAPFHRSYPNSNDLQKITVTIAGSQLTYVLYDVSDLFEQIELYYLAQNGAVESLICEGDTDQEAQIEKLEAENYVPYNYSESTRRFKHFNISDRLAGSLSTGYMPEAEHQAAAQLFTSELIFMRKNEKLTSILATKKQVPLNKSSERMKSHTIDYQYSF
jgi:hypothetical protein